MQIFSQLAGGTSLKPNTGRSMTIPKSCTGRSLLCCQSLALIYW
jgi:hypothetical protein